MILFFPDGMEIFHAQGLSLASLCEQQSTLGRWQFDLNERSDHGDDIVLTNTKSGEIVCFSRKGLTHFGGGRIISIGVGGEFQEAFERRREESELSELCEEELEEENWEEEPMELFCPLGESSFFFFLVFL